MPELAGYFHLRAGYMSPAEAPAASRAAKFSARGLQSRRDAADAGQQGLQQVLVLARGRAPPPQQIHLHQVHGVHIGIAQLDGPLLGAVAANADAYLTADLRHHPASEHIADGGPALLDAAHWATERPWLDDVAKYLRETLTVATVVSDLDTDPWTLHAPSPAEDSAPIATTEKEL